MRSRTAVVILSAIALVCAIQIKMWSSMWSDLMKAAGVEPDVNHTTTTAKTPLVLSGTDLPSCNCSKNGTVIPSDTFVPVFVLTRDRLSCLKRTLESYQQTLSSPYEIIIVDHNSTYGPMMEYLKSLQTTTSPENMNVAAVHSLSNVKWKEALKLTDQLVRDYLQKHPHVRYYAVTDPDVALVRTAPDILLFYAALLETCSKLNVIGPQLQISNLPKHYHKRTKDGFTVLNRQVGFWKKVPNMATWNGVGYHIGLHPIDTTFSMRRRNVPFRRLQTHSVRTYAPYSAVHLDWYEDSNNISEDKQHYLAREKGANNWR